MIEKWNSMPEWLRWLLYFPAVLLLSVAALALVVPLLFYAGSGTIGAFFAKMMGATLGAATLVWSAFELAPRAKRQMGWAIVGLVCLLNALELIYIATVINADGFSWHSVSDVLVTIVWVNVGVATARIVSKDLAATVPAHSS